jgi:hypothetical protein
MGTFLCREESTKRPPFNALNHPASCSVLSQSELGQIANASRKVINRALAAFEDRGWVSRGYSTIHTADAEALRRFATDDAG